MTPGTSVSPRLFLLLSDHRHRLNTDSGLCPDLNRWRAALTDDRDDSLGNADSADRTLIKSCLDSSWFSASCGRIEPAMGPSIKMKKRWTNKASFVQTGWTEHLDYSVTILICTFALVPAPFAQKHTLAWGNAASCCFKLCFKFLHTFIFKLGDILFCCSASHEITALLFSPSPSRLALLSPHASDWGILM